MFTHHTCCCCSYKLDLFQYNTELKYFNIKIYSLEVVSFLIVYIHLAKIKIICQISSVFGISCLGSCRFHSSNVAQPVFLHRLKANGMLKYVKVSPLFDFWFSLPHVWSEIIKQCLNISYIY